MFSGAPHLIRDNIVVHVTKADAVSLPFPPLVFRLPTATAHEHGPKDERRVSGQESFVSDVGAALQLINHALYTH